MLDDEDKPCRACTDFKTWAKKQNKTGKPPPVEKVEGPPGHRDCPLTKDQLGNSTWAFLHTMAAYYPKKPTTEESNCMTKFFKSFSLFYPCEPCALDFQKDIEKNPPLTNSREALSKWLCERHNTVNAKLDKPLFDCSGVLERWKDGWADGSCD